jgi:hypothetical protein
LRRIDRHADELGDDGVATQRLDELSVDVHWRDRVFECPGSEIPRLACFDSPGPFTMQPMTATVIDSTPVCAVFQTGIWSRR